MASAFGTRAAGLGEKREKLRRARKAPSARSVVNERSPTSQDRSCDGRNGSLGRMISGEIIPRLLLGRRATGTTAKLASDDSISRQEAENFAVLPLTLEADALLSEVELFLDRGVCAESIFVDLLAPSARRLGVLWNDDECDFVDVTMGLWRLQEVLRAITHLSPSMVDHALAPRSVLIAPMPGDQHSFGALMVEEIFARAGWDSEVLIDAQGRQILALLTRREFDLIGLTLSNDCSSGQVSDFIKSLRTVSRNPNLKVLIGGRMVNDNPDMSSRVGADGTAADGRSALTLAEQLLAEVRPLATTAV